MFTSSFLPSFLASNLFHLILDAVYMQMVCRKHVAWCHFYSSLYIVLNFMKLCTDIHIFGMVESVWSSSFKIHFAWTYRLLDSIKVEWQNNCVWDWFMHFSVGMTNLRLMSCLLACSLFIVIGRYCHERQSSLLFFQDSLTIWSYLAARLPLVPLPWEILIELWVFFE